MASADRLALLASVRARIAELEEVPSDRIRSVERHELALRHAMLRLVAGTPGRTDGALTNENLCAEAGVARATMYRIRSVMDDWKAAQNTAAPDSPGALREQIRSLKSEIRQLKDAHSEERRSLLEIQQVLVQRVQGLTLALNHAQGDGKVADLDLLRRQKNKKSGAG